MRRARREDFRRNQILARPNARQRIQSVRESFTKDDDVRCDVEILYCPEFSSAIETHLNFVIHEQNVPLVQNLFQRREIFSGRNYIAAGSLNWLGVERSEFRFAGLRVPERVVFSLEVFRELIDAIEVAILSFLVVRTTKAIWKRNKVRAIRNMRIAPAITIA